MSSFQAARKRKRKVCSVTNVLETSQVWRDRMIRVGAEYPDVELSHMYVDTATMQLVRAPASFDVIVTGNMFGDILSDEAAMLSGSIGMCLGASASRRALSFQTNTRLASFSSPTVRTIPRMPRTLTTSRRGYFFGNS